MCSPLRRSGRPLLLLLLLMVKHAIEKLELGGDEAGEEEENES